MAPGTHVMALKVSQQCLRGSLEATRNPVRLDSSRNAKETKPSSSSAGLSAHLWVEADARSWEIPAD